MSIKPDYSFEREGIPLPEWLLRLVDDEPKTRELAGKVLHAMMLGLPSSDTDLSNMDPIPDTAGQMERFKDALQIAVNSIGFDTGKFISMLCAGLLALTDDWRERYKKNNEQWEELCQRLVDKMSIATDDATRKRAADRLFKALCASIKRDWCDEDAKAFSNSLLMYQFIFSFLDTAFLAAPEALQLILENPKRSHYALQAISRIGPAAIAFAPSLLEKMDQIAKKEHNYIDNEIADALASIGKGNREIVDAVIERLENSDQRVRSTAALALSKMGTNVAGRTDIILAKLGPITFDGTDYYWCIIDALASVGRHDKHTRQTIIDFARPRPAKLEALPDYPQYTQDKTMVERGYAINAMCYFIDYPNECIPVLIDAIETFEEFDPDEMYVGPAARVARVLEAFGPSAAPAAKFLAAKLEKKGDFPKAILKALAAIGPAAHDVLATLEQFRIESADEEPLADLNTTEPDEIMDPVGWTIKQIMNK